MKITLEESRILEALAEEGRNGQARGPKPADFDERRAERHAQWNRVGDLINRYEEWLKQN